MQDSPDIPSFDKKFVNDSWNQLKSQLDRQQPVVKDNKRHWIKGLLLLQLLSAALIAYLVLHNQNERSFSQLTKTEIQKQEVIRVVTETKVVTKETYKYETSNPVSAPTTFMQTSFLNTPNKETTQSEKRSTTPLLTLKKEVNSTVEKTELAISLKKEEESISLATGYDLGFIKEPLINFKNIKYGIGIVSSVTDDLNYTGIGILASVKVPISQKLNLNTGIGFNRLSREFLFLPLIRKPNGPNYKSINLPQTFYDNLEGVSQIFIPFSLSYNLNNKVGILAGLNFRHTFKSSVYYNFENRLKSLFRGINEPLELYFNDTNVGLSLGVDYKFNNHWSMSLNSEWGMSSIISKDQFDARNPNFDLNLFNLTTLYTF